MSKRTPLLLLYDIQESAEKKLEYTKEWWNSEIQEASQITPQFLIPNS